MPVVSSFYALPVRLPTGLRALSAAIAAEGQTIRTRTGVRAHPALRDELANRALVARLLVKLGIASEPVKSPGGR